MRKKQTGVLMPFDLLFPLDRLSDAAAGQLLRAVLHYGCRRELLEVSPEALPLWWVLRSRLDLEEERCPERISPPVLP